MQASRTTMNEMLYFITKTQRTVERLADQYKVSRATIERDAKVADAINAIGETSPEAKRMNLSALKVSRSSYPARTPCQTNIETESPRRRHAP
jgi:predicted DNA-binding transcriptional regulator YafY